jgi:hypothetical protein
MPEVELVLAERKWFSSWALCTAVTWKCCWTTIWAALWLLRLVLNEPAGRFSGD